MRKLLVVFALVLLPVAPARAQSCPGVAPWVFADVSSSHAFCTYVTWMAQNNVSLGCRIVDPVTREYCPDDYVTRLQMAAFMNRLGSALFPLTCAAGQVMKWNGLAWTCANDSIGGSGGGGTVTSVAAGTGLTASPNPITGAGVVNLALGYQLPQSCANGQVAKSNGSGGWTCAGDNDTNSGGTVTSLAAGTGITLSANPITTTGSIAVNTAAIQARVTGTCAAGSSIRVIAADGTVTCQSDTSGPANAYVQGGNAFGALPGNVAVLGTTDGNALDLRVNSARVMRYEPNAISPNVIGGSPANTVTAGVRGATIAGGGVPTGNSDPDFVLEAPNRVTDAYGTVGGGYANRAGNDAGTTTDGPFATVGGGVENTASGPQSTIGGGYSNTASGNNGTVGGGYWNTASGSFTTVGGGNRNTASDSQSTVGGGVTNTASNISATVGGGGGNHASGGVATIAGGQFNAASGDGSTVGGGEFNTASALRSMVGGGGSNTASGLYSTVGGGGANTASAQRSTVGGGVQNTASGLYSTVGGGRFNTASGDDSWAGGRRAKTQTAGATPVVHHGAFVWADSSDFDFNTAATNEFAVRATGGVRFAMAVDGAGVPTRTVVIDSNGALGFGNVTRQMINLWSGADSHGIGIQNWTQYFRIDSPPATGGGFAWYRGGTHSNATFDPGTGGVTLMTLDRSGNLTTTGTVNGVSDVARKTEFVPADPRAILERVAGLPIATWRYRDDPAELRHIGPMAQDFAAAFAVGMDDKHIAMVDADGVALAAIQGLNEKLEARLADQSREIAELRALVERLIAAR